MREGGGHSGGGEGGGGLGGGGLGGGGVRARTLEDLFEIDGGEAGADGDAERGEHARHVALGPAIGGALRARGGRL